MKEECKNCYFFEDGKCVSRVRKRNDTSQPCKHYVSNLRKKGQKMTNAEKFEEVFRFKPEPGDACSLVSQEECRKYPDCRGCHADKFWDRGYEENDNLQSNSRIHS